MDESGPQEKKLTEQQQWVRLICIVCGWDAKLMGGRAAKLAAQLRNKSATREDLLEYYGQVDFQKAWWWYRDDWRGKRGERPKDHSIRETWGLWEKPIAVAGPSSTKYDSVLAYLRDLENGDRSTST